MQQRTLGKYQILERVAAGGQGTVYRAQDPSSGEIVALKVLHPHIADNQNVLERFRREAQLAASISHPNIVQIFEIGEDDGQHFIAMEYLPVSVASLVDGEGGIPIDKALDICIQAALGLQAASERGIIHRDIKPPNLLLDSDGTVKLTDFGIARAAALSTMTQTGAVMGTPSYMSPEQARGDRVDSRSDIYAMGVVLYHLLTGNVPFDADTPYEIMRQHIEEQPVPLTRMRPDAPPYLESVVSRCLEKSPDYRYLSHGDLADALTRVAASLAERQTPPSDAAPPQTSSRSRASTPPRTSDQAPVARRLSAERAGVRTSRDRRGTNPWVPIAIILILIGGVSVAALTLNMIDLGGGSNSAGPPTPVPPANPLAPLQLVAPVSVPAPPVAPASAAAPAPPAAPASVPAPPARPVPPALVAPPPETPIPAVSQVSSVSAPVAIPTGPPDLAVANITWLPFNPQVNDIVTFRISVVNSGPGAAQPSDLSFFIGESPSPVSVIPLDDLPPGGSTVATLEWMADPGAFQLRAVVDPRESIEETDEFNNELVVDYQGTLVPDLVLVSVTWEPPQPAVGEPVTVYVTTSNQGDGEAPSTDVEFNFGEGAGLPEIATIPALTPGQFAISTFEWLAETGPRTFTATVDLIGTIAETSKTNNSLELDYNSTVLSDLVVSEFTWDPAAPVVGDVVTFTATIANHGLAPTRPSTASFHIDESRRANGVEALPTLAPDERFTQTFTWTAESGSHAFTINLDPQNSVAESDEDNQVTMTVEPTDVGDLVIDTFYWEPRRPSVGVAVTFTADVRNRGLAETTQTALNFYKDGDSGVLDSVVLPRLAPGESTSQTFNWSATAGAHLFRAVADPGDLARETDETNNEFTVVFDEAMAPDLVVDRISWRPLQPSLDETVTFTVTVRNRGAGAAGLSRIEYYKDDSATPLDSDNLPAIPPGRSVTDTFNWRAEARAHIFRAVADSRDEVDESDESNNELVVDYDATRLPDLTIQNISWTPIGPSIGDQVTFTVTVRNRGGAGDRPVSVDFYQDDQETPLDTGIVPAVLADDTVSGTFTWTAEPGRHSFRAVADPNDIVDELDETNNERTVPYDHTQLADLVVGNIQWEPLEPAAGDQVNFVVTILNRGAGHAERSDVDYHLGGSSRSFGGDRVSEIPPGESTTERFTWTAEAGNHRIRVYADSDDDVVEIAESNNEASVTVSVTAPIQLPDLVIENITWEPSSPEAGEEVTVTVTIANRGNGEAPRSDLAYYLDGSLQPFGTDRVSSLSPGETTTERFDWTFEELFHIFRAEVDPDGEIEETAEYNNSLTVII